MEAKRIETLSVMPMYICDGKRKCSGSLACHNHPLGLCNFINSFDFDIEYDDDKSILRLRCVEKEKT